MKDLILFSIDKNHFALELDKIKRIVQAMQTTPVAGNADEIEGVFTFEGNVLNVLDFRTMIGIEAFHDRYDEMFPSLKKAHELWITALSDTVANDTPFTEAISPHDSALGKWLGSFNSYDPLITDILKKLATVHTSFHGQAEGIIHQAKIDKESALNMVKEKVEPLKEDIIHFLDELQADKHLIANSMQKFLILDAEKAFAVRIDEIDDIIAIDESDIQSSETFEDDDSLVKVDGIFEYKEMLVNLIGSIKMPKTKDI